MAYKFDYNLYKRKVNKPIHFAFPLIFLIIIVLLGLAVYLKPQKNLTTKFYFVMINSYLNYSSASKTATDIQSLGGAGYIYYDGVYNVFASFYPSKSEAENVVNNLIADYPNATIYTLETKKFSLLSTLTSEENKILKSMVNCNLETIESIYENIINYDKDDINEKQLKLNINNIISTYEKTYSEFSSKFNNTALLTTARAKGLSLHDEICNLTDVFENENPSQKLKYSLIKIVLLHSSFLSAL